MTSRPLLWNLAPPDLAFGLHRRRRARLCSPHGGRGLSGAVRNRPHGSAGVHSKGHERVTVWTLVVAVASIAVTVGCGTTGPSGPAVDQALAGRPEALIQLRSEGCKSGRCPVYSVAVYVDGSTVYRGGANIAPIGQRRSKISNANVAVLISTIDKMDFLDMPEHCCDCPDTPTDPGAAKLVLDYRPGGVEKEIVVDAGCSTVPDVVRTLVRQIQAETSVASWCSQSAAPCAPT